MAVLRLSDHYNEISSPNSVAKTKPGSKNENQSDFQVFSCEHCIHSDKCIENNEGSICICRKDYHGPFCDKEGSVIYCKMK